MTLQHFSEYELRRVNKNTVRIGNVVIENCIDDSYQYFKVNNSVFAYSCGRHPVLYTNLQYLYATVNNILDMQKSETFKARDIMAIAGFGMLIMFAISGAVGGGKSVNKDKQQNIVKAQQQASQIAKDTCFVKTR